jgi:hypothetical protein
LWGLSIPNRESREESRVGESRRGSKGTVSTLAFLTAFLPPALPTGSRAGELPRAGEETKLLLSSHETVNKHLLNFFT